MTWRGAAGRPLRAGLVALVLCLPGLGLGACGRLPVSEQVRSIRSFDPQIGTDDPVEVGKFPHGPVPGQSPERVVEGFIGAADADDQHHNAARAFLAPGAAWNDSELTIYDATSLRSAVVTPGGCVVSRPCKVRVSVRMIGLVKPDGRYQPSVQDRAFEYTLDHGQGEWQIAAPASTALITLSALARGYHSAVLYFIAKATGALVPQPILLADSAAGLPTSVAAALLAGPPAGLTGVLTTAIPPGSTVLGSVTVDDGHLTADVRMPFGAGQPLQRATAWTQLRRTLSELPGVREVTLQLEGLPAAQPTGSGVPDPDAGPRSGALVIRNGHVDVAGPVGPPVPGQRVGPATPGPVAALAVSATGQPALMTMDGRLQVWRENGWRGRPDVFVSAAWLDRSGLLAVRYGGRAVEWVGTDGAVAGVKLQLPDNQPIDQIAISADGSRIAAVAGGTGSRSVYLGRAGRDTGGHLTVGSTGWVPVVFPGQDALVTDWSSALDIVALVRAGSGVTVRTMSLLPGSVPQALTGVGLPGPPMSVAGGTSVDLLVGVSGHVFRFDGTGRWVQYGQGRLPAYPG